MTLRDLTLQELHHLHRHELREAFPPEELKPFAAMKKLYRAGVYHPVGAWEGETLVGYALLWEAPQRKYVLIDSAIAGGHSPDCGPSLPAGRRGGAPPAAAGEVSVLGWDHRGVRGPGRGPK